MNVRLVDRGIQPLFLPADLAPRDGMGGHHLIHPRQGLGRQHPESLAQKRKIHGGLESQTDKVPQKLAGVNPDHHVTITVALEEHHQQGPQQLFRGVARASFR